MIPILGRTAVLIALAACCVGAVSGIAGGMKIVPVSVINDDLSA